MNPTVPIKYKHNETIDETYTVGATYISDECWN